MKKRAAKRYDYQLTGLCTTEKTQFEIQLFNISTSGIQFGSQSQIAHGATVQLMWNDDLFGKMDPTLMIAREALGSKNGPFPYLYGAQYYSLNESTKYRLLLLLKHCKQEQDRFIQEQVKGDSQDSLSAAMKDGESILLSYFKGNPISPILKNIADQIKDYEKKSFSLADVTSICIQKLTVYNFQCQVLIYMLKATLDKPPFYVPYLTLVSEEIDKIAVVESSVEEISKEEANVEAKKRMNESSNRLFYTKQALLQAITESFKMSNPVHNTYDSLLLKMRGEYEKLMKVTEIVIPTDSAPKFDPSILKAENYSKAEAISDILPVTKKRHQFNTLILTMPILILMMGFFGIKFVWNFLEAHSMNSEMRIPLTISRFEKMGSQLSIFVPGAQWQILSKTEQQVVMGDIRQYLVNNNIDSCAIYSNDEEILQIIYKDTFGSTR